jgi:hypothetical protein
MTEIKTPCRAKFHYPRELTTLPDYTAHAEQVVDVVRPLIDIGGTQDNLTGEYHGPLADPELPVMYLVRASDGWEGHADEGELEVLP